jgi:hypothetical protein
MYTLVPFILTEAHAPITGGVYKTHLAFSDKSN